MAAVMPQRRAVLTLSSLNFGSKLLAIGKTLLIATLFGTSGTLDAFWVAYSLPLTLPTLLTTVITVAFVPRFVKNLAGRTGPQAWRGANTLFTLAITLALVACATIFFWPDALVARMAPGLAPPVRAQAVSMMRLMLPCMLMLTMTSLLSALSYARERFALPAMDGVVINLSVIAAALLLARTLGVRALIAGITLGFFAQLVILLVGNRDLLRSSLRPAFALGHPDFLGPLAHLLPLLVGSVGAMLTGLVDQYFVSRLDAGSISALTYALMIAMLPVEVFAQAIITTHYPALGRGVASGNPHEVATIYRKGERLILLLTLPCAVLLITLARPIVVVLLEHGRFDAGSTSLTVEAMSILAVGMVFRSQAYFSYRVMHSMLRPWTQVAIGLAGVATCIGLNLLWAQRLGLRGVALSAVISQVQSALVAAVVVARLLHDRPSAAMRRAQWRLLLPIGVLALGVLGARWLIPQSLYEQSHRLWALAAGISAIPALALALAVAWWMRIPELVDIFTRLRGLYGPGAPEDAVADAVGSNLLQAAPAQSTMPMVPAPTAASPIARPGAAASGPYPAQADLDEQERWIAAVVDGCRARRLLSTLPYAKIAFWNEVVDTLPTRRGYGGALAHALGIADLSLPWRLLRAARGYDLVLLAGGERGDLIYAAIAGLLPGKRPPCVIADVHWQPETGVAHRLQRAILRAANRIVVQLQPHSEEEVAICSRMFGLPQHKFLAIPYSSSLTGYRLQAHDGDYILGGGKSFRDYPTLLAGLRGIDCEVRLGIAGDALAQRVRALVDERTNVRVYSEWSNADFLQQMAGCRIFVMPLLPRLARSAADQTLLNAMALSKIVVATDSIGPRIYIEDGVNGFLVREGAPDDWQRALSLVLALDAASASRISARARHDACVRFNERLRLARILQAACALLDR